MLTDNQVINILNHENFASIPSVTNQFGIGFREGTQDLPSITPVAWIDIKSANAQSDLFRTGRLKFESNIEDEIYKSLFIDRKDILFVEDIKDILLNPTMEKLQKVIDIKSLGQITRVKGIMYQLKRSGEYEITDRTEKVVDDRYYEINNGQLNSSIIIRHTKQEEINKQKEELMQQAMSEIITSEKEKMREELEVEKEKIKKQLELEYQKKLDKVMNSSEAKTTNTKKTTK